MDGGGKKYQGFLVYGLYVEEGELDLIQVLISPRTNEGIGGKGIDDLCKKRLLYFITNVIWIRREENISKK